MGRLCELLVSVLGYRFRGLGSIPAATIFSEKQWPWNGAPLTLVSTTEELLEKKKVAVPV
jgi:hypothetical protein